jgi:predicted small lipoprotein YifL
MKLAHAALATAVLALTLAGCGLEGEKANIYLQNNSEETVVLQKQTDDQPIFKVTAKPHTTELSGGSPAKGHCLGNWAIVDASGKVLKNIDKVCAFDTVVYP